jgi:hypothetical protein
MTTDLLWTEASRDLEAEHAQLRLFEAQQRTADLWPFVALARSQEELGHRLALIQDTLTERVPDLSLHGALIEGLTANLLLQGYSTDPNQDSGEDEAPNASTSGLIGNGSSLQDQDGTPDLTASRKPVQIWHEGKRQWITVTADAPGNPAYFSGGPEAGPNTGQTGSFPVEPGGPDPVDPINGNVPLSPTNVLEPANRFPAQPQPWTVPADKGWVEYPMTLGTTTATLHTHPGFGPGVVMQGSQGKLGEWNTLHSASNFVPEQANPNYFDQGQVGLESPEGAGFPVDEALPEPNERVDLYQNAMPAGAGGAGVSAPGAYGGPAVNFTNPPQYVTSAIRNNVGTCAADGCGRPVYRQGAKWHHLDAHLKGDHNVMLDADHPWVQEMAHSSAKIRKVRGGYAVFDGNGERQTKAMLYSAALKAKQANQYIRKDGDQWVITQKGTGKVLSHHDSEEEAEKSFSAMEMHKHEGRFVRLADGTDPSAAAAFSLPETGGSPMNTPAPAAPPSMAQGGAGAEAMPPMQKPSGGSTANVPTPGVTGSRDPHVVALFHVGEDMVRGRPTSESPTGVPDEFTANTWEGPLKTHPRQSPEQRGINTPQTPSTPIPQISSSDNPGQNERSAEQDEDDEDED